MELLDHKQKQLGFWETVDNKFVERILSQLSSKEDFSIIIEHEEKSSVMCIAFDRGLYTLFVQLGDDEFYDYVSHHTTQDNIEFIECGQNVTLDKRHLVPYSAISGAIQKFADDPNWVRTDPNWNRQT